MSTVDPRPEDLPPGLVAYVAGGYDRVSRAFSRTLTSLAERGWLVLTPEDTGASTAQLVRMPARGELPAFEVMVLMRVQARSRSMPTVPLSVLTDTRADDYQKWSKSFTHALNDASRAFGLATRRIHRALMLPVALLTAAVAGGVAGLVDAANRANAATGTGFLAFIFGLILGAALSLHHLTDYGKQVATWGRSQLDRGTVAGAQLVPAEPADAVPQDAVPADGRSTLPATVAPAPLSPAEFLVKKDGRPLPAGQAWSSYPDRWHVVTVGSVDLPTRGRPKVLALAAYNAVFFSVPFALLGLLQFKGLKGEALAVAPATIFVLFGALIWFPRFRKRLGVTRKIVYRGQVVKRWLQSDPQNDEAPSLHCLSVDDGLSEAAHSFPLKQKTYKNLQVGDLVQVTYSPRWQLLRRIRRVR